MEAIVIKNTLMGETIFTNMSLEEAKKEYQDEKYVVITEKQFREENKGTMAKDKKLEEYKKYRYDLKQKEIGSFIDQNGRTYSVCGECDKKDCVSRRSGNGCMIGVVNGGIKLKIARG